MQYLVAILLCLSFQAAAQETFLYLNKIGRTTKVKYFEGEDIRFKIKSDEGFSQGKITGFGPDYLKVSGVIIPLDTIESIDIRNKNFSMFSFRSTPGKLGVAGFLYVGIDWFNRRVVSGGPGGIDGRVAVVAAGLSLSGILLKALQKKYFVPGRRKTITIINYRR